MSFTRAALIPLLGKNANFLRLKEDSKRPTGSYSEGKRNRLKRPPKSGNYGIIPLERLIVLDIDTHPGGSPVEDQISIFSDFLEVDLTKTFTVETPSKGFHFYLWLPEDSFINLRSLPRASLRVYQDEFQDLMGTTVAIDADIRSGAANGYVVGPESVVDGGLYRCVNDSEILEIPYQGLDNMLYLQAQRVAKKRQEREAKKRAAANKDQWIEGVLPNGQISSPPPQETLERVRQGLRKKSFKTFHQKRAFVYYALTCCYTIESIADACADLDVDRDTASRKRIPRRRVISDLQKIDTPGNGHSTYCAVGFKSKRARAVEHARAKQTFEDYSSRRVAKMKAQRASEIQYFRAGSPKVIDITLVFEALTAKSNRKRMTNQMKHCLGIVEFFLQPLSNLGARKIVLSKQRIAEELSLTDSQVTQALRLLRQVGVIELASKQVPGMAASYYVSDRFKDKQLTQYLKFTWGHTTALAKDGSEFKPAVLYLPREHVIVQAFTGEKAHTNSALVKLSRRHAAILEEANPPRDVLPLVRPFLRNEGKKRGISGLTATTGDT